MSVEELEKAIESLPEAERWRLHDWLQELMADAWDRQIEADIKAGKLDALADAAIAEHKAGLTRKL